MRTKAEPTLMILALLLFATFPGLRAQADEHAEMELDKDGVASAFHEDKFQDDEDFEEVEDFEALLEEMSREAEEVLTPAAQEILRELLPDAFVLLSRLEGLAKLTQDPEDRLRVLERKIDFGYNVQELAETRKYDASAFEVALKEAQRTIKIELLSLDYDEASKEAKPSIEKKIRTLLEESFAVQQRFREEDAKMLEEELRELQELLVQRQKNKSIIIDRHLYELLHDGEDPLAW